MKGRTRSSIYKRRKDGPYCITYSERPGVRRTVRGCRDLKATEALARKLETDAMLRRKGIIDAKADQCAKGDVRPLVDHLDDLHAGLIAKGITRKQANPVRTRARGIIEVCNAKRISDLSPSRVQLAVGTLRDEGLSLQTCNFYLQAIKQFFRWLWQDGRIRENGLAHLKGFNVKLDRRHDRRALEPDELRSLLETTRNAPKWFGMTGPERSMLYRLAVETGL